MTREVERAAWLALARRSFVWASALARERAAENAAHKLREELHQVGAKISTATRRMGAQPDQSSDCSTERAGSCSVKWCCCRFKVFALECDGQHYCRCGYPIKRYALYDTSPAMQALLPIVVVLAVIGLLHLLIAPVMDWDGTRHICDNIVVACP
jgi:hypothetical protein